MITLTMMAADQRFTEPAGLVFLGLGRFLDWRVRRRGGRPVQ